MIDERPAGLRQGEHRGSLAAAAPAPPRPQAAGIGDRRVARLGARDGRGHTPAFCARARPSPTKPPTPAPGSRSASTSASRRSSVIGATVALASVRSVAGGTGKTAVGRSGRCPDGLEPPEVGIHDHADRPDVTDRRNAADREPGQLVGLAGGCPPNVPFAGDGRQPREIDAIVAGDEAEDRLEARPRPGRRTRAT